MATTRSTIGLPTKALKALGLSGRASLEDARRAHRALAFQLHPDRGDGAHVAEKCAQRRTEQLLIANAAREAIELAVRQGAQQTTWTNEARRQWDESTKRIHLSAMLGHWDEVIDAISMGVDPNSATPAQGAPPIFYAACCDMLGKASTGRGDDARLRVLEVLASNPGTNLSLKGTAMWAEGRSIYDLVSMGRCSAAALDSLSRGQDALMAVLCQGRLYRTGNEALCFAE
jgi:hypothetical protein